MVRVDSSYREIEMSLEKLGFEHIVRRLGILNYIGNRELLLV